MKPVVYRVKLLVAIVFSAFLFLAEGTDACPTSNTSINHPGRLYTIPTTDVLSLGWISLGGGQAFGKIGSDLYGRIGVGIAPYTEIQINTQKIVNQIIKDQKINTALTPGIKLAIPYIGKNSPYIPSFALSLRHNFKWMSEDHRVDHWDYRYEKTWTSLFVIGSETYSWGHDNELSVILGWKLNSVRIRFIDPNGNKLSPQNSDYHQKNLGGPFGGITLKTTKKSWMMIEVEHIPSLPEPEIIDNHLTLQENDIKPVYLATVGTRYYILKWIGFDVGVQYRDDKPNIADMSILFGLNLTLSVKDDLKFLHK